MRIALSLGSGGARGYAHIGVIDELRDRGHEIVGIAEVCAEIHPDSTTDDPRWECVDIKAVCDMPQPVTLKDVKANAKLADMALVTSMRLSVQPVTKDEWLEVCRMGGLDNPPL